MAGAGPPPSNITKAPGLRVMTALITSLLLFVTGCTGHVPAPQTEVFIDLVAQDWQHVPGVTPENGELRVGATARSIAAQDGPGRQPDPPLNLAGTHLLTGGDFSLEASFTDVSSEASWSLYDSPPVIADEFRIEPAGLRLTLDGDDLHILVFDGSPQQDVGDPRPVHDEHVTVTDPEAALSVRRSGEALEVASGAEALSSVPLGGVFASGEVWLGLSSDAGSFIVTAMTATAPQGAGLATAGPVGVQVGRSVHGLQHLADRARPGFTIGAAVALGPLVSDAEYARQLAADFGAVTPENAMKAQSLSPQRDVYTFEEADALLAAAGRHGMAVHGHAIAFSEAQPPWMQELPTGSASERADSAEALLDYVTTVVTHFKGRLASLDVVNEPFDVDQGTGLQENTWYRVFGPEYPAVVSQAVYDADPDVEQFINENGADVPGPRQDALRELALDTNASGGHIYGVGLQSHVYDLDTDAISAEDLTETLASFEDAGLHVRISENDVTDGAGPDAQARQYATVVAACLRTPVCTSYTTWGVDDRYDRWADEVGTAQQGHDLLFDDGRPVPAHEAVRQVLGGRS